MRKRFCQCVFPLFLGVMILGQGLSLAKSGFKGSDLSTARGIVKPVVEAVISSEIQARVIRMPFRDGQRFKKGQTLVEFDCDKYYAELAAAKAELKARQTMVLNNQELATLHGIGRLEVEMSQAEWDKAKAAVKGAKVVVSHCHITAPFSGRVVKRLVNPHESVNPFDELLSILNDKEFDIELILPSSSLRWMRPESPFSFFIDETQEVYPAKVVGIGARVDPVSQTIRVFGRFQKTPPDVLAGMSGSARFADNTFTNKRARKKFKPNTTPRSTASVK